MFFVITTSASIDSIVRYSALCSPKYVALFLNGCSSFPLIYVVYLIIECVFPLLHLLSGLEGDQKSESTRIYIHEFIGLSNSKRTFITIGLQIPNALFNSFGSI